jgi:hypothetical protein
MIGSERCIKTANEVLGKRPKQKYEKGLQTWTEEIQKIIKEKK